MARVSEAAREAHGKSYAHLYVIGFAIQPNARVLVEQCDSVFGVRDSLVKEFEPQPATAPTPDGRDLGGREWTRVRFDIVLAPDVTR